MKKRNTMWVYVRNSGEQEWQRRILVEVNEYGKYSCVVLMDEEAYEGDEDYTTAHWNYMREIANFKLFRQKFFLKDL